MAIKKVWIEDGCTSCNLCEDMTPEVFELDDTSTVLKDADFVANDEGIREAAENCPVDVIKFEE